MISSISTRNWINQCSRVSCSLHNSSRSQYHRWMMKYLWNCYCSFDLLRIEIVVMANYQNVQARIFSKKINVKSQITKILIIIELQYIFLIFTKLMTTSRKLSLGIFLLFSLWWFLNIWIFIKTSFIQSSRNSVNIQILESKYLMELTCSDMDAFFAYLF